jgi:hypothetical protein
MEYLASKGGVEAIFKLYNYDMAYAKRVANNIASDLSKEINIPSNKGSHSFKKPVKRISWCCLLPEAGLSESWLSANSRHVGLQVVSDIAKKIKHI